MTEKSDENLRRQHAKSPDLLMSFIIKSKTQTSTFTGGAYDAMGALLVLNQAKALGPNAICIDQRGRSYSEEDLIKMAKLSEASAGRPLNASSSSKL